VLYILVLDDDEEDLDMVRRYLSFLGYRVETACDAEEGCNLFDSDLDCGLVVTKMKVRDINGNDIAQYIRNSQRPQTPIIAIGRTGDNIDRSLFNSVLMTPCKLKLLGETVSSFMSPIARM
jgi:DNA-binding response OmpR family regulator